MKSIFFYPKLLPKGLLIPLILLSVLGILVGFMDSLALAMIVPLSEMIVNVDIDYSTIPLISTTKNLVEDSSISFNLTSIVIMILVFQIIRIFSLYLQGWFSAKYSAAYEHNSRTNLLNSYSYMPWEKYVIQDSGDVYFNICRVTSIASVTYGLYCRMVSLVLTIIVYLVTAIYATWQLTLVAMIYSVIAAASLYFLIMYAKKLGDKRLSADELIYGMVNQLTQGMKYIRVSGLIERQRQTIITHSKKLAKINESLGINLALFKSLSETLFFIALILLLVISTQLSVLSSGGLLLFSLLFFRIFQHVRTLQSSIQTFLQIEPYVSNMNNIFDDNKKYIDDLSDSKSYRKIKISKDIVVQDLNYSYVDGIKILKNVSMKIEAKRHTAIVGLSGVGKTTLLDLLIGLINPKLGTIKYDNKELSNEELKNLRRSISYVPQGGVLFSGTLLQNIVFGEEKFSEKNLKKSLEVSNVNEFLRDIPNGLETKVGDGGYTLSGGQRQRVILARAIYRNPSLLILDEATSELDAIAQNQFIKSVNLLDGDITVITVAHRLSNIIDANIIYVMKDGEVIESGNFSQLISSDSEFSKMYKAEGNINNI
ncbi:MAG: hypothetical protein CL780_02490 [Chloroflexi bacterium]|nr:hypothetical protein [Chloroflexota bacterium]|tara:strand:- start:1760 stop:3550 length:1791 start_codon:yes stop_codon:yes gene_type:complete